MASTIAKKAAGTYVEDLQWNLPSVLLWLTAECRSGNLAGQVKNFCDSQSEILEHALVVVESITNDSIQCRIPCRCYDHESSGTFFTDVRFTLDPQNGVCRRS